VPPNPLDGISEEDPVASLPEPPAEVGPAQPAPAQPTKLARDVQPAAEVQSAAEETASIGHPVPPGSVPGAKKRKEVSLLEILMGN
jgi:penicillin-binding protein 1A